MKRCHLLLLTLVFSVAAVLSVWGFSAWSQARADRAALRAFYTAPPVIPHDVPDERDAGSCLMCHQGVMNLGDRVTMATPHPQFGNCMQCHVRSVAPGWVKPRPVETGWQGLEEPKDGSRAHEAAPPTIPHRLFLRGNCLSCHAENHPNEAARSPHPERSSCRLVSATELLDGSTRSAIASSTSASVARRPSRSAMEFKI